MIYYHFASLQVNTRNPMRMSLQNHWVPYQESFLRVNTFRIQILGLCASLIFRGNGKAAAWGGLAGEVGGAWLWFFGPGIRGLFGWQ
jgi:hypothetical protein